MASAALHEQLPDLVPAALGVDAAGLVGLVAGVEAHAATGCSRCARALVNARDGAVDLAASVRRATPRAALRERVLATGRAGALASRRGQTPRRFFDAAGEVARLHIGAEGEAQRVTEIDALGFAARGADDPARPLLAELQRAIAFPLLFVSVVRGDRVGYRVQCGFEGDGAGARDRRRETTFCTHTVSTDGPLVVPDAAAEPFFRGSRMVLQDRIGAYVGVPLRTPRGIVVGTVCAMDFGPRPIGPAVVREIEHCAERIAAAIFAPSAPRA